MDTLAGMRAFVRVVQAGGFAKAARRLELSPAMVTKHVSALEARLGVRLLNRTTRQVSLTDAGAAYYEHCARILAEIDETEATLAATARSASGSLRITAGVPLGEELAELVVAFMQARPGIEPELVLENRFVDMVEERYDVAIRGALKLPESSLVARPLARSRLLLCASPGYVASHGAPASPEELEQHRFLPLIHPQLRTEIQLRRAGEKRRVRIAPVMRSNSERVLREACASGAGIMLLTSINAWRDLVAGRLVPVLGDWRIADVGVYALYPHRRLLAAKVRAFVDFVAERLGGDATRDPWWERVESAGPAAAAREHRRVTNPPRAARMSLPPPVERTPFHTRTLEFNGYLRVDGLWDIEGRLRDTKSFEYLDYRDRPKPAGAPIHEMAVRLTIDDDKVVRDIAVSMPAVPYGTCHEAEAGVRALVGARIGAGWKETVRERLPARETCTHLAELIVAIATAAYQMQALGKAPQGINPFVKMAESHHKPYFLNKCRGWRIDGPVVAEVFPRYAKHPAGEGEER